MRFILLVCAVMVSGCSSNGEAPGIGDRVFAGALGFDVNDDGTLKARHYNTAPGSPWPTGTPGHENDGFHSYWTPQTGPVTCNTFGTFTSCN